MIKRTIEISQEPFHVSTKLEQLQLVRREPESAIAASIPCEDIGVLVVDQAGTTYSHAALAKLMEHGAAVVICGRNHLPSGLLLPLSQHAEVVWRIREQLSARRPVRKRLWQQLVAAKLRGQAANLEAESSARRKILGLVREIKSGDPTNVEAQAAKIYWEAWLGEGRPFRRDAEDPAPLNAMLNYGYAIVRASLWAGAGERRTAPGHWPAARPPRERLLSGGRFTGAVSPAGRSRRA